MIASGPVAIPYRNCELSVASVFCCEAHFLSLHARFHWVLDGEHRKYRCGVMSRFDLSNLDLACGMYITSNGLFRREELVNQSLHPRRPWNNEAFKGFVTCVPFRRLRARAFRGERASVTNRRSVGDQGTCYSKLSM